MIGRSPSGPSKSFKTYLLTSWDWGSYALGLSISHNLQNRPKMYLLEICVVDHIGWSKKMTSPWESWDLKTGGLEIPNPLRKTHPKPSISQGPVILRANTRFKARKALILQKRQQHFEVGISSLGKGSVAGRKTHGHPQREDSIRIYIYIYLNIYRERDIYIYI